MTGAQCLLLGVSWCSAHLLDLFAAMAATWSMSDPTVGWITHVVHSASSVQIDPEHFGLALHPGLGSCTAVAMLAMHVGATGASVGAFVGAQRTLCSIYLHLRPRLPALPAPHQFPSRRGPSIIEGTVSTPMQQQVARRQRRRGPPLSACELHRA